MRVQVRLRVPEISVAMDAKEFEILQDVAAHLAGEQVRVHPTTPAYWLSHLRLSEGIILLEVHWCHW